MESLYKNLGGTVIMPEFNEKQLYMHKTDMKHPFLPYEFREFTRAILKMLDKVKDRDNVCYITIHSKTIKDGTHRRGGIHVDYNWYEEIKAHGGGGHKSISNWGYPTPSWNPPPSHKPPVPGPGWGYKPEHYGGMLLTSDYPACKVWKGEFEGEIGEGGDCKNINLSSLESEIMPPGEVFYLNPLGIHESLKISGNINRTVIRINFHPEYIFQN
jgi:hypothetical protein